MAHVSFKVTPEELAAIREAARVAGKSMTQWCREKLVERAERIVSARSRQESRRGSQNI